MVALFTSLIVPGLLQSNTNRIGVVGRYHVNELPYEVTSLISGGLTTHNSDGDVVSDLADSWSSEDGKTWEFKIKDEVFWQDGTEVNAEDINYEFSDVVIEKPDDKTIIFKLKEVFSPFPSVVSKPFFKKGLIGFGEWKVDEIILSGSFVSSLKLTKENETITIKFYPNEDRAKLAYKLGKVDTLDGLFDPKPLDGWVNTKTNSTSDTNKVVALLFNTSDPFLSDKSIRQGLSYGIEKSFGEERAVSPISPNSFAYNPQVKEYDFDLDRARELLENVPEEMKNSPIKIASTPALLSLAEEIEGYWEDLGLLVEVQVSAIVPDEFQTYLTIIDIPKDPDQYAYWHSTQSSSNLTRFSNPRVDKLLEDGRAELDQEKRKRIYLDFQRFLLEEAPAIFLFHPRMYSISR